MANLSALPSEVLHMIIDQVMPEDLENFAQTSKCIQSVSASAVKNHREFIRKYTLFSDPAVPEAVESLLSDILANPRIRHYVKNVQLRRVLRMDSENPDASEQEDEVEDGNVNNRVDNREEELRLDRIHAAVDECKLLDPQSLAWFHRDVDQSGEDVFVTVLLSLLPHLTVLSITEPAYFPESYKMIERAKEQDTQYLRRLQHVHIQRYRLHQDEDMMSLKHLEAFLLLPLLRKLSGTGVLQTEWSRRYLEPPQFSNVTELELRECYIDSKILDRFLQQFPHLQSFVYTHFVGTYEQVDRFDPFIIRAALQSQVPSTLRSLTILMDTGTNKPNFMGPLCGFKALEHVHTDWMFLLPEAMTEPILADWKESLSLILPKSLKVLSVRDHGPCYKDNHRKLIDHAIRAKMGLDAPLPHLEALKFQMMPVQASKAHGQMQDSADQDLQKRCDEVGLSLFWENTKSLSLSANGNYYLC